MALVVMKSCSVENCNSKIWGKGVCKFHTPKTSINKVSKKQAIKNIEKQTLYSKQLELFEKHWSLKPHYCESCNVYLGSKNLTIYHDHLLEKNKFINLKFELKNLLLVCFNCHQAKTNGFPTIKHQEFINKVYEYFKITK